MTFVVVSSSNLRKHYVASTRVGRQKEFAIMAECNNEAFARAIKDALNGDKVTLVMPTNPPRAMRG